MMLLKRIQPIISIIVALAAYETVFYRPGWFFWLWAAMALLVALSLSWQTFGKPLREYAIMLVSLELYISGTLLILFFTEGSVFHQLIVAISVVSQLIYLTNIFYYYYRTEKYNVHSLQNISSYLNISAMFAISAAAFSATIYLNWPSWILTPAILILVWLVSLQMIQINLVDFRRQWLHTVVTAVLCTQAFWVVSFLPSDVYVNALVVTTVLYVVLNISRYHLIERLARAVWLRYFIVGLSVLLLALITARWV
jgi:hypothetical protein